MAVLTTLEYLAAHAPTLSADAAASTFITIATNRLHGSRWGTNKNEAVALLAAHLMAMRDKGESAGGGSTSSGPVTSRKAGDVSENYGSVTASTSLSDAELLETTYGRLFLALRGQTANVSGPRWIGVG